MYDLLLKSYAALDSTRHSQVRAKWPAPASSGTDQLRQGQRFCTDGDPTR